MSDDERIAEIERKIYEMDPLRKFLAVPLDREDVDYLLRIVRGLQAELVQARQAHVEDLLRIIRGLQAELVQTRRTISFCEELIEEAIHDR